MSRIDDRINRRTALVQLTAATMFAAGAAKAQRRWAWGCNSDMSAARRRPQVAQADRRARNG